MSVRRRRPQEQLNVAAAEQITTFLARLPAAGPLPWFIGDAGYDPVQLTQALGNARAALLVRLRAGRCFSADPTTPPTTGRPRRHGDKLDGSNPATWPAPAAEVAVEDEQDAHVRVRAWTGLPPKTHGEHAQRDARGRRPIVRGTRVLVEVSRFPQPTREPQALWLWWHTPETPDGLCLPDLDRVGRADVRRFVLEHPFRFFKPTLNGTLPRGRSPEPADRWTWLVVAASTQLRLARPFVADQRLPWERPLAPPRRTPVRRAFSSLLPTLGSPAKSPNPCGRSPGRPNGQRSGRAPRYPAVTKALLASP
jgi:hypothetical protein